MNVVLIGMRGAGKTSISRRLSALTHRPVLSTDLLISYEQAGLTIPQILARHGGNWRAFRQMERQVVDKVSKMDNVIIDCGGGVVVDIDARGDEVYAAKKISLLKKRGLIVWLRGDMARLVEKVHGDPTRPTLSTRHSTLEAMQRRLPFYEEAADRIVSIDGKPRKDLALEILAMFPMIARQ
ncbi:MAG: shikimate kinase [Magnetococcales bacterium]|nr:shikimate kinase [Magnetococcales bacterium]MBF0323291.1 shikimate kinase [Magnetococcales bacterium]